ncbi:SDR family NAD(P)-dependent oxidoreductase [Arthrobacter sp. NPDC080073]|uniref:SDR family NAD(P)-dependent oxidoreductase n=1 Tax=Arthrobacter sp. NPDC080073 TaxID=3155919 RepID=UPI0034315120
MSGKTVFVTGSTLGIGLTTAKGFHACGARTIISSNIQQDLDSTVGELGSQDTAVEGINL